jgi:hypothetical protein
MAGCHLRRNWRLLRPLHVFSAADINPARKENVVWTAVTMNVASLEGLFAQRRTDRCPKRDQENLASGAFP